ncbi:nuclear transport factor 2 family protein [Wenzhouxiangella sp. XN201]|uniref:nuclear transport factor 2 family protein n=1 Tax=Wenzhouxiangella sp. XN201 TaxID=2710755 RepID=UPI0013C93F02|nr:nuclear transport factor 2 family protein [Wenzhouxiangella sp. XN201]NEZ04308.1 nuclear transport factor 2 family protein [Wenzhouxiangella sp. XN201]
MNRLIAALFALLATTAAAQDTDAEGELRQLLDEFMAGASANDAEMHDRFWSEDLVYTSSSGKRFGKAEIMQGLAEAPAEPEQAGPTYSARAVETRVFGDTAVITFTLVASTDGDEETRYFNTGVFRLDSDQWRAVAWQATKAVD